MWQTEFLRDEIKIKTNRSSRPEVFCKKGILRNFTKFTGNHQHQSLFFNKVAGVLRNFTKFTGKHLCQSLFYNNVAGVLRNFTKFTGKHLCQSLFYNNVAGARPATLLKKRLWYWWFPVNFVKFLRTPFYKEHLWWLLLDYFYWVFVDIEASLD